MCNYCSAEMCIIVSQNQLPVILNESWRQHPTKQQLYGHLPPITKTMQVRRTRHAGHCWGSGDELISDILLWTPSPGRAMAGRPARTYIQQLCTDTGYSLEDLPGAMDDRDGSQERVSEIRDGGVTLLWWRCQEKNLYILQYAENNGSLDKKKWINF